MTRRSPSQCGYTSPYLYFVSNLDAANDLGQRIADRLQRRA